MSLKVKSNGLLRYLVDETDIFFKTNIGKRFKKIEVCPDTYNGTSLLFYDVGSGGYYVLTFNDQGIYYIWVNSEGVKTALGHIAWGGYKNPTILFKNICTCISKLTHKERRLALCL